MHGNVLRGALGLTLRKIACVPECRGVNGCERRESCAYARIFVPAGVSGLAPSGLAQWPRLFTFRASHLDSCNFGAGDPFHFDVNLFDTENTAAEYMALAFAQLAHEGLGPGRRRVKLVRVAELDKQGRARNVIYESSIIREDLAPLAFDLREEQNPVSRLRVRFLTPTELKSEQGIAARPEFGILAARVRDRISTLRECYGSGALEIDFRAFGMRAAQVRMTRCELVEVDVRRRSSRTGQVHSIGGFVGEAEYEGELSEFVPFLNVAQWTGVGRQTVWGKGAIEIQVLK